MGSGPKVPETDLLTVVSKTKQSVYLRGKNAITGEEVDIFRTGPTEYFKVGEQFEVVFKPLSALGDGK